MTERAQQTIPADASLDSFTDPAALADRDDVEFVEQTYEHDDPDHFEPNESWAGLAIVGVTDERGTLLVTNDADSTVILPYAPVDPGEDYVKAAVEAVKSQAGFAVELDAVDVVRKVEHRLATDADRTARTYDVLFEASPAAGATVADDAPLESPVTGDPIDDEDYRVDWFDEPPAVHDEMNETVLEDVRRFFD